VTRLPAVPARMSFEDVARRAALADGRVRRAARAADLELRAARDLQGPWTLEKPGGLIDPAAGASGRLLGDWSWNRRSPDDDARGSMTRLRGRARNLEETNAYAESYLNAVAVNMIGPKGFQHEALVRDNDGKLNKRINDRIEKSFEEWSQSCTRDGRMGLVEFEHVMARTAPRDGEGLVRECYGPQFPYGYALEGVDPDLLDESFSRIRNEREPEVRLGVEVDEDARPTAYHLLVDLHRTGSRRRERVEASRMIHLARFRRVGQTRGITWMRPVMIALRMLDGYEEAELIISRVCASAGGFFTANTDKSSEYDPEDDDPKQPLEFEATPGVMKQLPKGWDFKQWSPEHPTSAFAPFVKGTLRKVASGLAMSYNALTSDLEGVNYSSMRSGLLVERDSWRCLQTWWVGRFRQRIYRNWLSSALLSGQLKLDTRDFTRYLEVQWHPRGWSWVDPLKDVTAAVLAITYGLGSRTEFLGEEGRTFERILENLLQETKDAMEKGVPILGEAAAKGADAEKESEKDDEAEDAGRSGRNGHHSQNRVAALLRFAAELDRREG